MPKIVAYLFVLIFFLSFHPPVFATNPGDVLINEFSPKSDPEWIELYNPKDDQISVAGWTIKDAANHTETVAAVCILPHGFYTFERSKGWLNDSGGDSISLLDDFGAIMDNISYGTSNDPITTTPASDKSASRVPDGSSDWQIGSPTRQDTSIPCPVPTPSPTPTPTSTPTPAPTHAKSPSPTAKISPAVLGETQDSLQSPTEESTPSPSANPTSTSPSKTKIAAILTGSGAILIGFSVGFYLWYNKVLARKEEDQNQPDEKESN